MILTLQNLAGKPKLTASPFSAHKLHFSIIFFFLLDGTETISFFDGLFFLLVIAQPEGKVVFTWFQTEVEIISFPACPPHHSSVIGPRLIKTSVNHRITLLIGGWVTRLGLTNSIYNNTNIYKQVITISNLIKCITIIVIIIIIIIIIIILNN